jgi:hypothetical protein
MPKETLEKKMKKILFLVLLLIFAMAITIYYKPLINDFMAVRGMREICAQSMIEWGHKDKGAPPPIIHFGGYNGVYSSTINCADY